MTDVAITAEQIRSAASELPVSLGRTEGYEKKIAGMTDDALLAKVRTGDTCPDAVAERLAKPFKGAGAKAVKEMART